MSGRHLNNTLTLLFPEENHETLNVLQYVRPGRGFLPKFPVFSRIEVNGSDEHPLYVYLKVQTRPQTGNDHLHKQNKVYIELRPRSSRKPCRLLTQSSETSGSSTGLPLKPMTSDGTLRSSSSPQMDFPTKGTTSRVLCIHLLNPAHIWAHG